MIPRLHLNKTQRGQAITILKHNLETASDWIVLNYSLETFGQLVQNDVTLRPYFLAQLEEHARSPHKSVAKRAANLLNQRA